MNNPIRETKHCAHCGKDFACGSASGQCWCMKIPLDRATLEMLRRTYDDCLCEACLLCIPSRAASGQ